MEVFWSRAHEMHAPEEEDSDDGEEEEEDVVALEKDDGDDVKGICKTQTQVGVQAEDSAVDSKELDADNYPDKSIRVPAIIEALSSAGLLGSDGRHLKLAEDLPLKETCLLVHDEEYITWLRDFFKAWETAGQPCEFGDADQGLIPDTFAVRGMRTRPSNILRQAGWWCFDRNAPIVEGTYEAARHGVACAVSAARHVVRLSEGEECDLAAAYALCRPPGHHAGRSSYGGLCFMNNAAAAAEHLSRARGGSRVAIVDIDFSHGNGTQEIFYGRKDVFFGSVHADPNSEFPYFTGYADEVGEGDGIGCTVNVPLKVDGDAPGHGVSVGTYMSALDEVLQKAARFKPDWLVVSMGTDTCEGDPVGGFLLPEEAFTGIGEQLAGLRVPTVLVQEGGYDLAALGECVVNLLLPFAARQQRAGSKEGAAGTETRLVLGPVRVDRIDEAQHAPQLKPGEASATGQDLTGSGHVHKMRRLN